MNNQSKRLLTMLLALFMILTSFPLNAFAAQKETSVRNEITDIKTVGDKQVINLGNVRGEKPQLRFFSRGARLFGAPTPQAGSSSETVAQKVEINLNTMGLNLEENQFDPSALTEVGSFDVEITFKELGGTRTETRTMTFQAGETKKTETFYLPKDFGNGNVEAKIPKLKKNISLRVYVGAGSTTNFNLGQDMTYKFELTQIVHPVIDLKVVDPYGKELQENINQKLGLKLALEADHDFELPANTKTFNIRTLTDFAGDNVADLNSTGDNLALSLTTQLDANKKLKVGDKTYKLNKITYNALGQEVEINGQKKKVGGYIEFATQPKIIVPTPDDSGDLPKTPDGYKRLSFHAETSANANDGKFEQGEKLKVIDVLEGTEYTDKDLQNQIKGIGQPTPIIYGRKDDNKKFLKWNPELPTTGPVADTDFRPVYLADGGEITPGEPLPKGVFEVKVIKDNTIADDPDKLYGKSYGVFKGSKLARDKFPDLVAAKGYQNPKWTTEADAPNTGMVEIKKPWTKVITKATTFKATAAADAATQIKKEGLKAVDTTALQGQELTEEFWHKGVALADNTPADKKDAFEALLKDATVTDITNPARTTAEAGEKVGTLLVTFKDGSTLEVEKQKLIVKPNTVKVELDKDAQGAEKPLRDGDTTVKGKITASSNSAKFPVSLDGAVVTIKKGNTVLTRTLANADGSFVAGVKDKLIAGEDISVVVTLPESKTESAPVTEKVQLNPDKLNSIIPTGQEVVKNLKGKKGVDQAKVTKLEEAITKAFTLVDKGTSAEDQMKKLPKATVTVDATGQKSLDDQFEAIKKAIEELTGNSAPVVKGKTSHKEIFKGDDPKLEEGITVTDADSTAQASDIAQVDNKDFTYAVQKVDAKGNKTPFTDIAKIKDTAGTYEVTYTAKDKSGAEGTFVMTLVVREPVIKIEDKFPEVIPEGYVKVEFKSGNHAGLKGTSKFLVKEGGAKSLITEPEIVPEEGWKVNDPKWTEPIPDTFATNFETTANMLEKVKTTEPTTPEEKAKYVTVEFKADDAAHAADPRGTFENVGQLVQTTKFWVLKNEPVKFNVPTVTEKENYKFTGWDNEVKASYDADAIHTATYKKKVVTQDPNDATNYAKLTFEKGDHGKFEANAQTTIWVLKDTEVKFNPPSVIANKDFTFDKWEPEIKKSYNSDQTHTAKYATTLTVSDEKIEGYQEVKFVSGTDGNFGKDGETPITTKSVWVKPDTLVDLRSKAPTVTVTAEKKSFVGWDKDLVGEFKLETENNNPKATLINAEYDATVKTEKPNKHADKFVKVDFSAGNLGTIADDATKTFWVVKGEKVTDTFKAPTVTPVKDWKVKEGKAAWSPEVAETYNKDTIHLAQYDYTGGGLVEQKPGDPKPNVPDKFKKIEFKPGAHGIISSKETTIFWADPDQALKLTPPKVIANTGYVHDAWDPAVPTEATKFTEAKTYTATYKNDEGISETPKPGYIAITFDAGEKGRINGNKTKTVYANPEMEVTLTAPEVTPNPGYLNDGWDPVVPTVKTKFTQPTTYTAKYKDDEDISKTEKPGYIPVTFDAGLNGTIEGKRTSIVYVNPAKAVKVTAPTVDANAGYTFDKWDPAIPTDAKQYTTPAIYTANYTKGADISETEVKGFIKVSFNAGDHGNFGMTTTEPAKEILSKDLWVRPNTPVDLTNKAPSVTPKTGWLVNGWSRSLVVEVNENSTVEDKTITAQYVADTSVSETEKPGYTKITFKAGEHGNFGVDGSTPVTEKNLWLNPEADVKLSEKAPKTIDDINWSFDKWMDGQNPATGLDQAKKYTEAKTYTATYESDFSDVAKEGFAKVEFKAGDHGKFEQVNGQDQVTTIYVRKDKEIDITVKEPKVTPDNGYYFTGWDKPLQKVYTADTTHTGKNEKAIATEAVEGWTQITFNAGDKGLFKPDAKTVLWVKPNIKITLKDQVPGLEIEKGYSCIGWKKDAETNVTDLTVPATYDKSTNFTAAYESDFSKETKEGFIEVKFKAGDNGNFGKTTGASSTEVKDYSLWVRPDKEVDLTDQAPKVYPHVGWKANGWDKTLTITVNAQTAEADRTFTAQYLKDDDVSDTKKEGYIEITFNAGDHGTFPNDAKTVKYVNPDSEIALSTIAPTVNPAINYSFKAWNNGTADVALDAKIKYTQATNYRATYESDISDTPKNGFVEVKFAAGTDGEFKQVNGVDQKTTFYVKKDKLVDLSDVAPIATGKDKKTFTGWDSELKRTFTDASTTINAKYTESISDKYVEGWTQLDFDQGDHGRFVKGQKNVKWVDPAVDLKLEDIAPKIKADPNWTFKAWNDGTKDVVGTQAQKFTKATTFTATYEDAFSPGAKEGFVKVTFDQGAHGKFVKEAVKEIYVKKDVDLDLREKAPTVIPNQGWGHKGWIINSKANDLTKVKVSGETIITADYAEGTFDATKITKIVVLGPTQMGYGVGEKLNLDGLKVIAIDDAGLQETYDGVAKIEEKGFTIEPANKTELKMDDNGKHIVVTKGEGNDKVTGQTETTLTIHENKSAKAENVKALNQNIEENGKVTDKPKTTTTVTGKVKPGATVIIKDQTGNDITPQNGVTVDPTTGEFTAEVTKQEVGKTVKVIATERGKQPSDPADAIVARDANNNGIDDNKEDFDIKKADKIEVIRDPNKMNYHLDKGVESVTLDTTGMVVRITDTAGNEKTYTAEELAKDTTNFTVEPANGSKIGAAANGTKIKVTLKTAPSTMNPTFAETVQALKVTKTLPAPEVDNVQKGDTTVKVKVPTNGETKITVKVGDKEVIVEKDPQDSQWKVGNNPVDTVKGKLQITVDELKQGDVVKVTTEDPAGNQGHAEKQVPVDEYSADPTDLKAKNDPATPEKTTVTGKATAGAVITIKDEDGNVLTTEPTPITVGKDGTFKATIDKKDPNTLLLVSAKEDGKEPSADVPVQVEGSKDVVEKKPGDKKPDGFVEVRFVIDDADTTKGTLVGAKEFYVNPKVKVALNPPTVNPATGFKLDGWLLAGQATNLAEAKQYTEAMATETDTTDGSKYIKITAKFAEEPDIVEAKPGVEKPAGYVEIIFAVDTTKGKFADKAETKFFVNPKKDVTLTAPRVTVTDKAYTFDGWDNANWNKENNKFKKAKYETDTRITAKFVGSIVESPEVGDVITGNKTITINPKDADTITVTVDKDTEVVVKKDSDGNWKTEPDGEPVEKSGDNIIIKLPEDKLPNGLPEKSLVEITGTKDGVDSKPVVKTAQKVVNFSVIPLSSGQTAIYVRTFPIGVTITVYKRVSDASTGEDKLVEIGSDVSDDLGAAIIDVGRELKSGESFIIKGELKEYLSKEDTFGVQ